MVQVMSKNDKKDMKGLSNKTKSKKAAAKRHNSLAKEKPIINSLAELEMYQKENRSRDMLTVKDLIRYLKRQNPDACILGYERSSRAYIEQFKEIPNAFIRTVKEDKESQRHHLERWYAHDTPEEREEHVNADLAEMYRYAEDDDVIFSIGN